MTFYLNNEEDEDTDEKFLDDYERITNEYKERLGELTAIQNRNVDKKFGALRKTFSKISDKDKRQVLVIHCACLQLYWSC